MTDASGAVVWSADYKPFGEAAVNPSSTITNNLRFPGQYYDVETGLNYNYYRDCNPAIGKYIEADPLNLGSIRARKFKRANTIERKYKTEPQRQNLFAYAGNNPLKYVDPFGLSFLVFNPSTGTLTLVDRDGNQVGQYPAENNVTSDSSYWPNGTYPYSYHTDHSESGPNGAYGSNGNFVFDVPGHTGMGVHSGRRGPGSLTNGCIRTTYQATEDISNLNETDPLILITVL